jgi:hypothetical protein
MIGAHHEDIERAEHVMDILAMPKKEHVALQSTLPDRSEQRLTQSAVASHHKLSARNHAGHDFRHGQEDIQTLDGLKATDNPNHRRRRTTEASLGFLAAESAENLGGINAIPNGEDLAGTVIQAELRLHLGTDADDCVRGKSSGPAVKLLVKQLAQRLPSLERLGHAVLCPDGDRDRAAQREQMREQIFLVAMRMQELNLLLADEGHRLAKNLRKPDSGFWNHLDDRARLPKLIGQAALVQYKGRNPKIGLPAKGADESCGLNLSPGPPIS